MTGPKSFRLLAAAAATAMLTGIGSANAQITGGAPPVLPPNMIFNGMDTNKDGTVTKQEYLDYYAKKFDAADKNKDGKLTQDELPKKTN